MLLGSADLRAVELGSNTKTHGKKITGSL